jgi:cytoskeletal protein RodZ
MEEEKVKHVGQILKDYRLKKKVTIEKISNKTKISIQNLINIEEGNLDLIAGKFYQRSFIKSYVKALRISEKKILLLLDNVSHNSDEKVIFEKDLDLEATKRPIITEKIPTVPLMLFASLGLITFFLINLFIDIDNDKLGGKLVVIEPKSNIEIVEIKENLADKIKKIKEEIPIKQTNVNVDDIENYKILEDKTFMKQIIAKEDVWIEIKDLNENILLSAILKKNESYNLPNSKEKIIISASNAGALFIKNGDNKYPELGSHGTILDSVDLNSLITNH